MIFIKHITDKTSANGINPILQDALFLTAVFNSCINPLVYGSFYFKSLRKSQNNSGGQHYNTHSTAVPRSSNYTTCAEKENTDSFQQTSKYRREGGYQTHALSKSGGNKGEEKIADCKELQVFVTDYG